MKAAVITRAMAMLLATVGVSAPADVAPRRAKALAGPEFLGQRTNPKRNAQRKLLKAWGRRQYVKAKKARRAFLKRAAEVERNMTTMVPA